MQLLKEFVFPRRCAGCGVEIEAGCLCRECSNGLLQMKDFPPVGALDGGLFFFSYENYIRETIRRIKFGPDKEQCVRLSEEAEKLFTDPGVRDTVIKFLADAGMFRSCAENDYKGEKKFQAPGLKGPCPERKDIWFWSGIPTDPGRLRERGFDLPAMLFSKSAKGLGGIWTQVLCRTRKTLPMYGLSPEERMRNLQNCFAVTGNVRGKSIVLVDDIFTTGATFSNAAAVLKEAGAETVKGLAFCGSIENLR